MREAENGRFCSLIPGLDVKPFTTILAGPTVLSAVGACPPHRMGATHFLMKTLPRVASEMALHVLAYNLTRVMNIMGIRPLMAAMKA